MVDSMIRLFPETAQVFTTNGIGYLPDATECIVTEQRNGVFELKMKYPITGRHYSELQLRKIIVALSNPYSEPQPFRIYEISKPMKKLVTVYAEHISYDTSGYPVSPFEASNAVTALDALKTHSAVTCPFTFWTDKTTSATMKTDRPYVMRTLLGGVEGSILDIYGGEYEFDRFLIKLHSQRGENRGVTIRYGKNLTDVQQDENCAAVYTGVYPYWISDEDGLVTAEPKIVNAPGTYNFTRVMMLDCTSDFEEKPTPEQLKTRAESYISNNDIGVPKVSIDVSFVDLMSSEEYKDLQLLETVHLCDTVSVEFEELGVKATSKCVKTEYDALTNKYNSITLGETRGNIASTIVTGSNEVKTDFEKTIEREKYLNNKVVVTLRDEFGNEISSVRDQNGKDIQAVKDELGNTIITVKDEMGNEIKVVVDEFGRVTDKLGNEIQTTKDEFGNEIIIIRDEFGNEIQKIYLAIEALRTEQKEAIDHATKLITGNLGGNVILHSSTGGETPNEILIMDTASISTAKRVWRWNLAGLGYSNKGYNGPYELAMTMDGVIVADFVQAGTMSANRIRGGTLELGGMNNGSGIIVMKDSSGNVIGTWNNLGLTATGSLVMKMKIGSETFTGELGKCPGYASFNDTYGLKLTSERNGVIQNMYLRPPQYNTRGAINPAGLVGDGYMSIRGVVGNSYGTFLAGASELTVNGEKVVKPFLQADVNGYPVFRSTIESDGEASTGIGNEGLLFYDSSPGGSTGKKEVVWNPNFIKQTSTASKLIVKATSDHGNWWRMWYDTSSARKYKDVLRDMTEDDISDLYNIQPVIAKFKEGILDEEDERYGVYHPMFIADNVEEYFSEATDHLKGEVENWNEKIMIPAMFQMIKSQKEHIDILEQEVKRLKEALE